MPVVLSSLTVKLNLAVLAVFAVFYSIPAIPVEFRVGLSTYVGPVVFIGFTVAACWRGWRLPGSAETMFWQTTALAFALWFVIRSVLPYIKGDYPLAASIGADIAYALFYLTLILAIEVRPHLEESWPFSNLERALTWPAISLFVLGLLVYFVFIPLAMNPDQYATNVPSMYFFLALDLYIGVRLFVLAITVRSRGWKAAYFSFGAAMFGFAVGDLVELLQYKGRIPMKLGSVMDMIWLLPFIGVVIAAKIQPRVRDRYDDERRDPFDPQHQLIGLALVLPVIHFIGYGFGIFGDAGHALREITTLLWLVLLGSLALTQQALLQRKTKRLAEKTHETTLALRQSERTLRLMAERQEAIEAQRQSEINFSRVFNASPDPMAIFTRGKQQVLEVNESFERFWSGDRSKLIGRNLGELSMIHPRDLTTLIESTGETRGVHDFPAHVRTAANETRQCLLAAEMIEFSGESSIVLAIRDVTEQIELEAFRDSLIAQLEAKNAELERFTYTVSHDLKSPLITIKGFLGFLSEDIRTGNKDRLQGDLDRINDAANRMQRLLDELLELSRIGRIINDPEPVPLSELVREAQELVQGRVEERGVRIEVDRTDDMPLVHGDRVRLLEVLQNLLENAVKFMGDRVDPLIRIEWDVSDEERVVRVRVIDNGVGIDPRFHEKVFGLFEQLQADKSGTGIGLALVKRIVELHGGEITVESEGTGKGSTFLFTLPLPSGDPEGVVQ